jgi:SNF2 family DNA or RNA helicase
MNYQALIGKMTEYMHLSAVELSKWLEKRLPDVLGENWWKMGVLGKLSYNQQEIVASNDINSLEALDLSALLRVADKNWYTIHNRYFLNQSDRVIVQRMFGVRNNWAHAPATPPELSSIISDLEAFESFLGFVEMKCEPFFEFGRLLSDIKSNGINDVVYERPTPKIDATSEIVSASNEIAINSVIRLVSDHNAVGMVIGIDKVGDTNKYKVFIDGKTREFFEGQIEIAGTTDLVNFSSVSEIQRILTAYQIRKPSADSLYSLNAARIDFVPYQFRPALKLMKSDTPRLLIADSVGVGKTIEAGLLLKEMQARTSLDSILIICPKPLVAERKWELEMKRFDEDFTAVDGRLLRHIIQETERDGEWPDKYKRLIIPYSLLTEDLLFGQKKRRNGTPGLYDLDPIPFFDMVIVDEAHNVRNSNTNRYEAVKFFCDNANAAVFLTATPLQLGNNDLFTLLNLLYPDTVIDKATFSAMAEPNEYINEALRNLRVPNHEAEALEALDSAITTDWGRNIIALNPMFKQAVETLSAPQLPREQRVKLINDVESLHSFAGMITRTRRQDIEDFCVRRAYTLQSQFTPRQRELHDELLHFVSAVLSAIHPTISLKFLMCTIRRQAASCIFGLAPFIRDIVTRGLNSLVDDYDIQDELDGADIELSDIEKLAQNVIALAENLPSEDSKFDGLAEIIQERRSRENNKMIIFSTFRHTLKYLMNRIKELGDIRVAYVDGSVSDDDRYDLRERFTLPQSDPRALDVLLFTEVGSEGLDYQFCDTLVNYDLPWNPMRVEQRIGRIDRRGQKSEVAHIYNCITSGTIDEEIHERCLRRIGVFEQSIGDCSDILGNLAKSIQDIILDTSLTADECSVKLEQMADNEVRQVQEMRRLEDDEKQMFGLDISNFTDDVEKADNPWLSSEAIRRLVAGYLEERLGSDKVRLTDNRLRLTIAEKAILADDYKLLDASSSDSAWTTFLRSGTTVCGIAFSNDAAKDPKRLLLTPVHPLVRQAAAYYASDNHFATTVEISSSVIAPGSYRFQFYIWDYTGGKPRTQLIPVCEDAEVGRELSAIMQSAVSTEIQSDNTESEWDKLAELHLALWQVERSKYQNEAEALCRYRIESLAKSVNARKGNAQRQIEGTKNERIITMRIAQIERLDGEFATKKQRLEENARLADIHATLLVNGLLVVREE